MFEAAFSDVLEVILIILLIYFGFKIVLRWFGPLILKFFLKKIGKQFEKKIWATPAVSGTVPEENRGRTVGQENRKKKKAQQ